MAFSFTIITSKAQPSPCLRTFDKKVFMVIEKNSELFLRKLGATSIPVYGLIFVGSLTEQDKDIL